jgi:outer membrane lipoprotein SlyB
VNAATPPKKAPLVVKSGKRDLVIGLIAGALILGFLLWGIGSMSGRVADKWITGTITAKHFTPQTEQQITIGKGGMDERKIDGEYTFEIIADGKNYTVWVDKSVYDSRKVGESFRFLRPPPAQP